MHEPDPRTPRSLRSTGVLALGLGLVLAMVGATITLRFGTSRQASASEDLIASVAVLVPDDRLDPRLTALEMRGTSWTRAVDEFDAALFAAAENDRRLATAETALKDLNRELISVRARHRAAVREIANIEEQVVVVDSVLQARALSVFVGAEAEPLVALDDPSRLSDAARGVALGDRLEEIQFSTREELLLARVETGMTATGLVARAIELGVEITSTERVVVESAAAKESLAEAVADAADDVRSARWNASIPGSDLSVVALNAYLTAERLLAEAIPTCNAEWWMLAGVARIESRHGRFGGRSLRADGRVNRPIIGIALDGGPGVLAIPDSDGGEFDNDTDWDRAVGPLQFIPETWIRRGRDGSGDGYADPQNIYDAAYSAGRYLCALGGNLSSRANLRSAYFGYNNSSAYVNDVIGHADGYRLLELPEAPDTTDIVEEAVDNVE